MSEIFGMRGAGPRTEPPIRPAIQRAARQLETAFAAELMKSTRAKPQDGMFSGGIGAHSFDSFMDEALGEAMSRKGELGLAKQIAKVLSRVQASAMPVVAEPAAVPAPGPTPARSVDPPAAS